MIRSVSDLRGLSSFLEHSHTLQCFGEVRQEVLDVEVWSETLGESDVD
jgi:hypothetical protein